MSESKDYRRKASQWAFTLPSFSANDIVRLSLLISSEILYVAFAICDDDTGNRYIQGFVKTSKRLRIGALVRLMGHAIFSIVGSSGALTDLLTEIQLNKNESFEFGDVTACNRQGQRNDISMFKHTVKTGTFSMDMLKVLFPNICANYPNLVHTYLNKQRVEKAAVDRDSEPPSDPVAWKNVGSPKGLVWKVYQGWKKGEVYQPSRREWEKRGNALTNSVNPGPARSAFIEWCESRPFEPLHQRE